MIGAMFEANVKYEILDNYFKDVLSNIKYSNNVNIILDLKSVFRKCYRTDIANILKDQKVVIEDITSFVANMIGFYRHYLYKNGKYSTFYVLYSSKECEEMKKLDPEYKREYYNKNFKDGEDKFLNNLNHIISSSAKMINVLCKYIPNVYYIDTSKFDEFVYTNYLIRNYLNKNDINILLSSDVVLYQTLNKNTFALDLKGMNTKLISEKNVIDYLCEKETKVSGNLLTLLLSMKGSEIYSLKNIDQFGYKKSIKIIKDLLNRNLIVDAMYMNCPEEQLKMNEVSKENLELIKNNFKVLFPLELQMDNEHQLFEDINVIKPPVTYKQFQELNERVYIYYPINLGFLLKGETLA